MSDTHPPAMPEATRAQYRHRPDGIVPATADSSQTVRKALGDRGADEDRPGIIKARKEERGTITPQSVFVAMKNAAVGTHHQKHIQRPDHLPHLLITSVISWSASEERNRLE